MARGFSTLSVSDYFHEFTRHGMYPREAEKLAMEMSYRERKMEYYATPIDMQTYTNTSLVSQDMIYRANYGVVQKPIAPTIAKCKSCGKDDHKAKFDYRGRCENTLKKVWEKRQKLFRHRKIKLNKSVTISQ